MAESGRGCPSRLAAPPASRHGSRAASRPMHRTKQLCTPTPAHQRTALSARAPTHQARQAPLLQMHTAPLVPCTPHAQPLQLAHRAPHHRPTTLRLLPAMPPRPQPHRRLPTQQHQQRARHQRPPPTLKQASRRPAPQRTAHFAHSQPRRRSTRQRQRRCLRHPMHPCARYRMLHPVLVSRPMTHAHAAAGEPAVECVTPPIAKQLLRTTLQQHQHPTPTLRILQPRAQRPTLARMHPRRPS